MRCSLFLAALLFVPMLAHGEQPTTVPSTQPSDRAEGTWHESIQRSASSAEQDRMRARVSTARNKDSRGEPFELDRIDGFQFLMETDTFAWLVVGRTGHTSCEAFSFQLLMRQPDALQVFEDLLLRADLPGQLYALSAIGLLAPDRFDEAAKPFENTDTKVLFQGGCVGTEHPANFIIQHFHLDDGTFANELLGKLRGPK